MTISSINRWQALARPEPSGRDLTIAFAVMLEECVEAMDAMHLSRSGSYARDGLHKWCELLKRGEDTALIRDRKGLCDGLADVIVTAVGVGHCAKMNVPLALERVDESNWTKCVNGEFVRNEQGKITKPEQYRSPDLTGCY